MNSPDAEAANPEPAEALVKRALDGDSRALEALLAVVRDDIFGLSMRMLGHPDDAADATQEILLVVVTHLATFEHKSSFRTWCWTIAVRALLKLKKGRREGVSFEEIADLIEEGALSTHTTPPSTDGSVEQALLVRETEIGCTQGMLLALSRETRLAFILTQVLELSTDEAAEVLRIDAVALRKRVSRAKRNLSDFMGRWCGLYDASNSCRCSRQVPVARRHGLLDPTQLLYTALPARAGQSPADFGAHQRALASFEREVLIFRAHPAYAAPSELREKIRTLISSGRFSILND